VLLVVAVILTLLVLPAPIGIGVVILAATFELLELAFWKRFLRRYKVRTGAEALVGERAEVIEACDPEGRVRLRGELWKARAAEALGVGETARVTGVAGLTLEVSREDPA
jgi:membrane-bound serine protease (ClpP class)